MEKIESFEEVKLYLKEKAVLTTNGSDSFYLKDKIVTRKFNGNTFKIKYEDFVSLYKNTPFYLIEIPQDTVDPKKDEEYYGRIQRYN